MIQTFETYLTKLRETDKRDQTEHTSRAALERLLETFAAKGKNIKVQHEPRRFEDKGSPDYRITQNGMILGYVEVKALGANLDKVLKSDQIKKYLTLSQNIILTDYLHFILIGAKGTVKMRGSLAFETDLESRTFQIKPDNAGEIEKLVDQFFTAVPEGIGKSDQLAMALATRSKLLRDFLGEELVRQQKEHEQGKLWGLYGELKKQVFHELTLKEFADAFAQMLAYGLFMAKLNVENDEKRQDQRIVTLANAREFIPASFQLIRELVDFLGELDKPEYVEVKWVVEEVLSIVNGLNLAAISENLSFRQRKAINRNVRAQDEEEHRLFERDPFIYFYEDYLKAFDKETRKGRGVYYTPPPIVNFIVRAVDDILKDKFEIADGLADHKRVTVLDFACGTGTFLLEVMNQIFENIGGAEKRVAKDIVHEHILKNIYGFEYLIAPYTIAHLKLSQFLKDKGHPLKNNERLQVYLTNTLEPIAPQKNLLLPEVTKEVEAAQAVKDKPILVIVGNPPYSGHSRNNSPYVKSTIDAYKLVDGKPLGEKNPKWLQDDYVKFIRFAQMKMDGGELNWKDAEGVGHTTKFEGADEGIVGIITNHSWLDNPTFRGMRRSLMQSFEQIYVIDLHGNAKKKERAPDGGKDENVFDIEQGVAISLFVKKKGLEKGIWRGDMWGKRLEKYQAAMDTSFVDAAQNKVTPTHPQYNILRQNDRMKVEYESGYSLSEVFDFKTMGVITKRDSLTISTEREVIWNQVTKFSKTTPDNVRNVFGLPPDNDWSSIAAHQDLLASGPDKRFLTQIMYAPFDLRYTYYTGRTKGFMARPVLETMRHMVDGNIGLSFTRKLDVAADWSHVFVTNSLMTHHAVSMKEGNYLVPIYLDGKPSPIPPVCIDARKLESPEENLFKDFRDSTDARYAHHYEPEDILGYIYAILHTPSYRRRYAEFLRIDFPRIPFCDTKPQFDVLSKLGWELVQAHLLKKLPRKNLAEIQGKGASVVEAVRYSPQEKAIYINSDCCFATVPEEVWNFHIGGYQVLDKYLKSRKGRTLSLDEILHLPKVANSLAFTIEQMQRIDVAYLAAFPDRG